MYISVLELQLEVIGDKLQLKMDVMFRTIVSFIFSLGKMFFYKKMLISELDRTMRQGRILSNDELQEECDQLYELRERLNSYSQEINAPIAETGYSLFDVYGEMSQLHRLLQDSGHPGQSEHLSAKSMTVCECTRSELDQKTNLVQKLQEHLKTMGQPSAHPFQDVLEAVQVAHKRPDLACAIDLAKHVQCPNFLLLIQLGNFDVGAQGGGEEGQTVVALPL